MKRLIVILIISLLTPSWHQPLLAAVNFKKGTVLRDAECEKILKDYIKPIFQKAGLKPEHLHFYLLNDPSLNAFATSRFTIVMHSGLIQKASQVGEVIGVLAHETGHIAGGHMVRFDAVMNKSATINMASVAIGLLTMAATLNPGLGGAIMMGGMNSSMGNMLHYSRGQEAAADQAALRYLRALKWPSLGLVTFMEKINYQELLTSDNFDPYFRTHPLSKDRINFLKNSIQKDENNYHFPNHFQSDFDILKAKLDGFLNPPERTLQAYPTKNLSFAAQYARAIAFYRNDQMESALTMLNYLSDQYPTNPYIFELMGQILYENGQSVKAIQAYEQAHKLAPHEPLIKIGLAQVLIEKPSPEQLQQALQLLHAAVIVEDENPQAWHLLARTYGKMKNKAMDWLFSAEEALCLNKFKDARKQATWALTKLKDVHSRLRAHDIVRLAEDKLKSSDEDRSEQFNQFSLIDIWGGL